MGRSVMLGNGHMLVGLNESGLVHDFYYPYIGLDNLTNSRILQHNVGVWVNGEFSWLSNKKWDIKIDFEEDALVSNITATNKKLKVELHFQDFVDTKYTAFCRSITVKNLDTSMAEVRIFMHQAFQISRMGRGDTALFVPEGNYLLDYKGWCSLLIYAEDAEGKPFDQFAVGNYGIENKEGTYKDAEDGELSGNLVEHGGVDSVVRCSLKLKASESRKISYWVIAADSQFNAELVHHVLKQKGIAKRLESTRGNWDRWLAISKDTITKIDPKYQTMAKKSLLVIKSHIDRHGGIIASCDSSIYNYGRDYYSYVWPRDGGLTMLPLIGMGYETEPKKFFDFCADTMHPAGYMMHKYQPDRAVGSTWHPLVHHHRSELAIQEDETACVIYALGEYWKKTGDNEYIKNHYNNFIRPAANFMSRYIDKQTNLPHASYDLWEEKFATHTYTVAATVAALKNAAAMAKELDHSHDASNWLRAAKQIESGFKLLFNSEKKYYRKSLVLLEDKSLEFDETLDVSSSYGVMEFCNTPETQADLTATFNAIELVLLNSTPSGGIPRYEKDQYFLQKDKYLGNPWIICTLWLARYYIKTGRKEEAIKIIDWVISCASPSGMLPEQVDPEDRSPVGVSPLVWSHAVLLETLLLLYA